MYCLPSRLTPEFSGGLAPGRSSGSGAVYVLHIIFPMHSDPPEHIAFRVSVETKNVFETFFSLPSH